MSVNTLFAINGGVFLAATIVLLIFYIKYDDALAHKPGQRFWLHLGLTACIGIAVASAILSISVRECPHCGTTVSSNYCEECGYQVRSDEYSKELFCPDCGADITADTNFCGHCGTAVK